MKTAFWIIVPSLALLTLAPAHGAAGAPFASQSIAEKTKDDAEKTKNAVVKGAHVVADKTKEGVSKTGEVMTDAWITTRVHEQFVGEALLKDSDISVSTTKHVVTLKGTVIGRAGRTKATSIARHTEGVRRVVNHLTVGPKA